MKKKRLLKQAVKTDYNLSIYKKTSSLKCNDIKLNL